MNGHVLSLNSPGCQTADDLALEEQDQHEAVFQYLLTELTGRDKELAQLREIVASVRQSGHGQILFLTGEAGVGNLPAASLPGPPLRVRGRNFGPSRRGRRWGSQHSAGLGSSGGRPDSGIRLRHRWVPGIA